MVRELLSIEEHSQLLVKETSRRLGIRISVLLLLMSIFASVGRFSLARRVTNGFLFQLKEQGSRTYHLTASEI